MDTPTFITFMVMWMLLLFGVLGIVLTYRHYRHLQDLIHAERMNALDRGLEIPAPPPRGDGSGHDAAASPYLHRGIVGTLLGISLMAAFGLNAGARSALWGLPIAAFGMAYLILHFVVSSKEKRK
jgi:hypothetical protein